MIIIDEEEQTVRFAHHSVKQFFIARGDEPENLNPINPDETNKEMGRVILTYLNYGISTVKYLAQSFQQCLLWMCQLES